MTDYVDVVEHNPIVFVKAICDALANGYTVHNTNAGYPSFEPWCQVRLFKGTPPAASQSVTDELETLVSQYDPMVFMLSVQDHVNAGFVLKDMNSPHHYFNHLGLKQVAMERAKIETPKVKTPAKKALKAE